MGNLMAKETARCADKLIEPNGGWGKAGKHPERRLGGGDGREAVLPPPSPISAEPWRSGVWGRGPQLRNNSAILARTRLTRISHRTCSPSEGGQGQVADNKRDRRQGGTGGGKQSVVRSYRLRSVGILRLLRQAS